MAKSVYSLVLSSEIVDEIDRMAAREGMSRSGLINHVLAEYTRFTTPEAKARQVAQAAARAVETSGLRSEVSGSGALVVRTALRYKYNPAISYSFELLDSPEYLGQLRVSLRSTNQTLLLYLEMFFQLFAKLEDAYLPVAPKPDDQLLEPKRYTRRIRRAGAPAGEAETGQAIAGYIGLIDQCLATFFSHLDDANRAVAETEKYYRQTLPRLDNAVYF